MIPQRSKVLFVDDEMQILLSLQRLMRNQMFDIDVTHSPDDAYRMASENTYAVVVSDQRMPGMTGTQLLSKIRQVSPDTVRILLTGYADIHAAVDAINQGAVYQFLNKPWDNEALCHAVRQAVEHFELLAENQRMQAQITQQNQQLTVLNEGLENKVLERTREIQKLNESLEHSFLGTVQVLASLSELHSKLIGSHAKRVAETSVALGKMLGFGEESLRQLEVAALLHDLGKVALAPEILNKPEHLLQKGELERLRQHPIYGENMLTIIPNLSQAALFIRHHHERYDGSGYPDKLSGSNIPLGARIIAAADAYDKVLNAGSLTPSVTPRQVLREVLTYSGKSLDPRVLEAFALHIQSLDEVEGAELPEIEIYPKDLRAGMVLSRDLLTRRGSLLLAKHSIVEEWQLQQLRQYLEMDPAQEGLFIYRQTSHRERNDQ